MPCATGIAHQTPNPKPGRRRPIRPGESQGGGPLGRRITLTISIMSGGANLLTLQVTCNFLLMAAVLCKGSCFLLC